MKAHGITNTDELIKALRCEVDCGDCAYFRGHSCDIWGMMCDAADAIEELIKERDKYKELWRDEVQA